MIEGHVRRRLFQYALLTLMLIAVAISWWVYHFHETKSARAHGTEVQILNGRVVEQNVRALGEPEKDRVEKFMVLPIELPPKMAAEMKATYPEFQKAADGFSIEMGFGKRSPFLRKNGLPGYHLTVGGLVDQGFNLDADITSADETSDPEVIHGKLVFEKYPSDKKVFVFTMRVKSPPEGPILRDVEVEWDGPINP